MYPLLLEELIAVAERRPVMSAPRAVPVEVCVRVMPWLTRAFGHRGAGWLTLVRAVSPGTTLADLLWGLAREYPGFAEYALGRDGSLPCPYVCLALNGEAVAVRTELGRELRDGDRVLLLLALGGD